jgi:hypothetical protein
MTTEKNTDSPRGPSITGYDDDVVTPSSAVAATDPSWEHVKQLTEQAFRAIQELERVLFFTDLEDDASTSGNEASSTHRSTSSTPESGTIDSTSKEERVRAGLQALEELDRALFMAEINKRLASPNNTSNTTTSDYSPDYFSSSASASPSSSSAMTTLDSATMALVQTMELLKQTVQYALEKGLETSQKALKECERTLLFTDLDETALVLNEETNNVDVMHEIDGLLRDVERKLAGMAVLEHYGGLEVPAPKTMLEKGRSFYKQMEQKTTEAYKECERALLFTDLDETALAKDKSNDDVINHFLNSQNVFQELLTKRDPEAPNTA